MAKESKVVTGIKLIKQIEKKLGKLTLEKLAKSY